MGTSAAVVMVKEQPLETVSYYDISMIDFLNQICFKTAKPGLLLRHMFQRATSSFFSLSQSVNLAETRILANFTQY